LRALAIIAVALVSLDRAAWSRDVPSLPVLGQIGGPPLTVALAENLLLTGAGYRLLIHDVSDPVRPQQVGALVFADLVRAVTVDETRAYVAAGSSGLHVIDLRDPSTPSLVASWNSPGTCEGVAVRGESIYVADGPFGLRILERQTMKPLGSAFDDFFVFDVVLLNDYAVLAGADAGVLIADISNRNEVREVASIDTPGNARAVAIAGHLAAVADQWEGLRVIDVSNPRQPRDVAAFETSSWAMDVWFEANKVFVANGSGGVIAVDLTDPSAPRQLGFMPVDLGETVAVARRGPLAALASGRTGIHLADVTGATPRMIGSAVPLIAALRVDLTPSHAFVSGSPWLTVIDISAPDRPREIGAFGSNQTATSHFVFHREGIVYIETTVASFIAIDVSDPSHPAEISRFQYPVGANIYAWTVRGDVLYTAAENHFVIVDLSDSRRPVLRSALPMAAEGVAIVGNHAFVGQSGEGMAIIDIADPSSPRVVGRYQPPEGDFVSSLAAIDHFLFVPTCQTVTVLDVSAPVEPRVVGSVALPSCASSARADGNRLYVTSPAAGLFEFDISNPSSPVLRTATTLGGSPGDVAFAGSLIGVAARQGGLFLLDRTQTEAVREEVDAIPARAAAVHMSFTTSAAGEAVTGVLAESPLPARSAREIVVTSAADAGAGSLRAALQSATDGDVITFDSTIFPPGNPAHIPLTSMFGCIAQGVTIDGSNAGVVLDGSGITSFANGIRICGDRTVVMGLHVINFSGSGFLIADGIGSRIGGDPARGSGPLGEGNLASGNGEAGINTSTTTWGNRIVGNVLGLPRGGLALKHAQRFGIFLQSGGNLIGGPSAGERNVISGNVIAGVALASAQASHNAIVGNYLGVDSTGTAIAPSPLGSSSRTGISISLAHDNLVADNIIAAGTGVSITDPGASFNRIVRNRVGLTADGQPITGELTQVRAAIGGERPYNVIADNIIGGHPATAIAVSSGDMFVFGNRIGSEPGGRVVPNHSAGISIRGAQRAFIGGRTAREANLIDGGGAAVELQGMMTSQNIIMGNRIGLSRGNAAGLGIASSSSNVIQRNTIAGNSIGINSVDGSRNRIRRNSLFSNEFAGIRTDTPPTPPEITVAAIDSVSGVTCPGCLVEVFSDAADEGAWFEGEVVANPDGSFTMRVSGGAFRGRFVTATTTDSVGATSPFSSPREVPNPPIPARRRSVGR
jgi:parallel beta-helix repeat protein